LFKANVAAMQILITGASGSGTSTLGRALADELQFPVFDTDDYYWHATQPPFQQPREPVQRHALLLADLAGAANAVVAGSVMKWGVELEDRFDLIVFLYLEAAIRVERLRLRELSRYGRVDPEFVAWAAQYDDAPTIGRSLARHRAWLAERKCPIVELSGDLSVADRVSAVRAALSANNL
jgi:adenylate kinase family enzyme